MWEENLASLLLGRLASPVVRIGFKNLQRCCATSTIMGSPEAGLVARYTARSGSAVHDMLDALYSAASAGHMEYLTRPAFHAFHGLLSRALLNRVDEHSANVMADCEWALGGGTDRMSPDAFCEWVYDVLEAWSAEGEAAVLQLAEELLEAVVTPQSYKQARTRSASYTLRKAEDVEWSGLLRFRDRTGAPPVGLNWAQTKRLVEAAITWRAWGERPACRVPLAHPQRQPHLLPTSLPPSSLAVR